MNSRTNFIAAIVISWIGVSSPSYAQDLGAALHVGSLGVGADIAVVFDDRVALRTGGNFFPFDIRFTSSDIDYDVSVPSPQFLVLLDVYAAGEFRLSGGVRIASGGFDITGRLSEPVEIGGQVYTPSEVGNLTGTVATRETSPYIGIGFGNPVRRRVGFFFDLGVALHGTPEVSAMADGPVALLPGFQDDLDQEVRNLQDDLDPFVVYPTLSVGVSFRLGT